MIEYNRSELAAILETLKHDYHFPGHIGPGTAFIILGMWWTWNAFKRYYECEQRQNSEKLLNHEESDDVSNTLTFRAAYNGDVVGFFNCEGFYKILFTSMDVCGHLISIFNGGDIVGEWQHMTMNIIFFLNGIVDLMSHMKLYKMPKGIDYIASALAWTVFSFLLIFHTHGKTKISIFYHKELAWIAILVGVVTLMQYKYDNNTPIALIRGCCCTLVGTWFYQIAFVFHNPFVAANQYRNVVHTIVNGMRPPIGPTNDPNMLEMQIMNAATIFAWHVIVVFCLATFVGVVVATRRRRGDVHYKRLSSV